MAKKDRQPFQRPEDLVESTAGSQAQSSAPGGGAKRTTEADETEAEHTRVLGGANEPGGAQYMSDAVLGSSTNVPQAQRDEKADEEFRKAVEGLQEERERQRKKAS